VARLFKPRKKNSNTISDGVTVQVSTTDHFEKAPIDLAHLLVGSAQSVGMTRSHNEDFLFTSTTCSTILGKLTEIGIFVLADGMGGHLSGEVASETAVTVAAETINKVVLSLGKPIGQELGMDIPEKLISDAIMAAQKAVVKTVPGGGTTLTLALCIDDKVYWGHVGDSRMYHLTHSGEMRLITQDHTLVKRLVDLGQISEIEAVNHPQKNMLVRALGQSDGFKVDQGAITLERGERLLICSDGLWGQVREPNFLKLFKANSTPNLICELLVKAANDAGGPDNISVIIVDYF